MKQNELDTDKEEKKSVWDNTVTEKANHIRSKSVGGHDGRVLTSDPDSTSMTLLTTYYVADCGRLISSTITCL